MGAGRGREQELVGGGGAAVPWRCLRKFVSRPGGGGVVGATRRGGGANERKHAGQGGGDNENEVSC